MGRLGFWDRYLIDVMPPTETKLPGFLLAFKYQAFCLRTSQQLLPSPASGAAQTS